MKPRLDQPNLFARVPAPPRGVVGAPGPRYELGEILGGDSTNTVHRGRDTNFAREVAFKIIDGEAVGDPERWAEFITEARISVAFEHPNIVPVYDMDRTADGGVFLDHHAETPFTSGWIGFYGYYPGKEFSQVRFYAKGLPERVSVLTLGDNALQDGLALRAAEQYRRVTETFGASPLGQEALYRQGLALRQAEQPEPARQVWSGLSDPLFQALAACWQATDLIQANDIASALRLPEPGLPIRDPRLE